MKHALFYLLILVPLYVMAQNPCLIGQSFHVVILGSSTAAGVGPSSSDSTWVNRYRKYIQAVNPPNQVTNLAQGGTTTYHILPDWCNAPANRPQPNSTRNVSEALRLNADGIIVNMPSNDAALGFSVAEQLTNFRAIVNHADSAGIPVWVCTTQPRSFNISKRQVQMQVRDSVLQIFGTKAIDFWTGLADSVNQIDSAYDSGDGVHLNDAAHCILFQRVQAKNILPNLVNTLPQPDLFLYNLKRLQTFCGQKRDTFQVGISNLGLATQYALPIRWQLTSATATITYWDTLYGGISTCLDTFSKVSLNVGFPFLGQC